MINETAIKCDRCDVPIVFKDLGLFRDNKIALYQCPLCHRGYYF